MRIYQRVFLEAYGEGPYECFFCRKRTVERGRTMHIHHINRDRANHHPMNLAAAHISCHRRWHVLVEGIANRNHGTSREGGGHHWSEEERQRARERMTGSTNKSRTGMPHSPETKAKMSAAHKKRWAKARDVGN